MIKDDTKEQIPLFEVPEINKKVPISPATKPSVKAKVKEEPAAKKPMKDTRGKASTAREERGSKRGAAKGIAKGPVSGQVPEGDVRLTANIRDDLHLKLKIAAARRRTTIGELLEELVEKYL
ncbi:MAG TPA: hypothetical protein VHN12_10745 [Geobacteraceae bacterium]|nr:hypothetical protein [Geobacteraceae bacterium]